MLGKGRELVAWMEWRGINDNLNYAAHEWLKENPGLSIVTTRLVSAQVINGRHPMWLMSIARCADDGSPIVWTSDSPKTEDLVRWANGVFERNTENAIIDVQIAGCGTHCSPEGPKVIEAAWALLVIACKATAANEGGIYR